MATIISTASTGAVSRVFAIPELVGTILIQLDLRTLLLSQRVSRQWRDVIKSSQTIQERLFFTATKDLEQSPEYNPLLKALFPPLFAGTPAPTQRDTDCLLNPLTLLQSEWYMDETRREKVMREDASWRRMLPISPSAPITTLTDVSTCGCWTDDASGTVKPGLQDPETGCTMGLLYDIMIECIDSDSGGGMLIEWSQMPEADDFEDVEKDVDARGRYISRYAPREPKGYKREIEIYIKWHRDCYARKGEGITGLEIINEDRKKRLWNVKWKRSNDDSKKKYNYYDSADSEYESSTEISKYARAPKKKQDTDGDENVEQESGSEGSFMYKYGESDERDGEDLAEEHSSNEQDVEYTTSEDACFDTFLQSHPLAGSTL